MAISYNDSLFRIQLPEFADTTTYPMIILSAYFTMAQTFITADGSPCTNLDVDQVQLILNYFTAHLLILGRRAQASGPENNQGGIETSASIGEISVANLAPPVKDGWDYWMYQTPYGQAIMALLSMAAAGGFSVGGLNERSGFRKAGGIFW